MARTLTGPGSCLRMPFEDFRSAWLPMVFGVLAALGIWQFGAAYVASTQPVAQHLVDEPDGSSPVHVFKAANGGAILIAHYTVGKPGNCVRIWNDKICQNCFNSDKTVKREYFDLASGISGSGFDGGTGGDYWVTRDIPAGLQPGEWQYFQRVYQQCGWFYLVPWLSTSRPVTITIP